MSTQAQNRKAALLTEIEKLVATKAPAAQREQAKVFATKYCNEVDVDDFIARDANVWATLSLSHFAFGNEFQRGAPKMRIFNPKLAENGWDAANTVIEFINDDMPFLVDSIAMEINRQGVAIQLVLHPLFDASRDQDGVLTTLDDAKTSTHVESWIHVEVERITDLARIKALGDGLVSVLNDVRAAVEDFALMKAKIAEMLASMGGAAKVVPLEELDEARAFLAWTADHHFTFLGYRDYELTQQNGTDI